MEEAENRTLQAEQKTARKVKKKIDDEMNILKTVPIQKKRKLTIQLRY